MSGYALHPDAFGDLDEIWEYIAQDNVDAADRVLADIHSTLTTLAGSPHIGHRRPDLTTRPLDKLRDEAPAAYKDIRAVLRAQHELVKVTRVLRPVLNYKGS